MAKDKPKLLFGEIRGQHRLAQSEETKIAKKGEAWIRNELLKWMMEIQSMNTVQTFAASPEFRHRFNSLIWVYVQLVPERIKGNLWLLMTWSGVNSINKLARAAGLNPSFVGRMLEMNPVGGIGGWNSDNVFKLAGALGIDPRVLLFGDLRTLIDNETIRLKSLPVEY